MAPTQDPNSKLAAAAAANFLVEMRFDLLWRQVVREKEFFALIGGFLVALSARVELFFNDVVGLLAAHFTDVPNDSCYEDQYF